MKKIMVIDGGPRKNMNTAAMVDAFAEGAREGGAEADGLVLASPIYYGEVTAMARAFWERLTFPWLSYKDGSFDAPKKMPVTFIYTMNGMPNNAEDVSKSTMRNVEFMTGLALGCEVEVITACNTTQVNDYSRYHFADGTAEAKAHWRVEHWEDDLTQARNAGKRMATRN